MIKKDITYKDFNGNTVTDPFAFHLSPADLLEMEAETPGGVEAQLQRIRETQDGAEVWSFFKNLVTRSIGKVSPNGKQFIHNQEIQNEFLQSNAFSVLLLELVRNEETAAQFFNALMPEGLDQFEAATPADPQKVRHTAETTPVQGLPDKVITKAEAEAMDADELLAKVKDGYEIRT